MITTEEEYSMEKMQTAATNWQTRSFEQMTGGDFDSFPKKGFDQGSVTLTNMSDAAGFFNAIYGRKDITIDGVKVVFSVRRRRPKKK